MAMEDDLRIERQNTLHRRAFAHATDAQQGKTDRPGMGIGRVQAFSQSLELVVNFSPISPLPRVAGFVASPNEAGKTLFDTVP